MNAITTTGPALLERAVIESGLRPDAVESLRAAFAPHFIQFGDLVEAAKTIPATSPKAARELRLALKAIRVAADKTRKDLKEDSLRRGKAIDGINNLLEYQIVPVEQAMEKIEKAEEIAEEKRRAALIAVRSEALRPFCLDVSVYKLDCSEEAFQELLRVSKQVTAQQAAAKAKAEEDRQKAEHAAAMTKALRDAEEAAAREKMQAENARLAAVAAEERKARIEAEKVANAERAKAEAAAAVERSKLAAEKAEVEKLAAIQREEHRKTQAALAAQEAAEAKRIADEKAAAAVAAAAPDKEKLLQLSRDIRFMALPVLTSPAGAALHAKLSEQVAKFADWVESEAWKLTDRAKGAA